MSTFQSACATRETLITLLGELYRSTTNQEFPDNSQNDLYLTLAEEFDSITASIVELDDYQLDYFYEVHDPETATDLWNNIYAAEREKEPAKNLKAINKKKSK